MSFPRKLPGLCGLFPRFARSPPRSDAPLALPASRPSCASSPDRTSRDTFAQNASQQIRLTNSVAIVGMRTQCPELDIPALNGLLNRSASCA